jgi:hypothetical protein
MPLGVRRIGHYEFVAKLRLPERIDVALNEATWRSIELLPEQAAVRLVFDVLTLPEDGDGPGFARVGLLLEGVRRVAASYRLGHWSDPTAEAVEVSIAELPGVLASFGGMAVYGFEFFDPPSKGPGDSWERWRKRLSLDARWAKGRTAHVLELFQETSDRILAVRVWFETLRVFDQATGEVPLDRFTAGGVKWWDAMFAGDERTKESGISPLPAEWFRINDMDT